MFFFLSSLNPKKLFGKNLVITTKDLDNDCTQTPQSTTTETIKSQPVENLISVRGKTPTKKKPINFPVCGQLRNSDQCKRTVGCVWVPPNRCTLNN